MLLAEIAAPPAPSVVSCVFCRLLPFHRPPCCHPSSGSLSRRAQVSEKAVAWLEGRLLDGADGTVTEVKR